MYTCTGCGWTGESVGHYRGVAACSDTCAKRAWKDRYRRAIRSYQRLVRG